MVFVHPNEPGRAVCVRESTFVLGRSCRRRSEKLRYCDAGALDEHVRGVLRMLRLELKTVMSGELEMLMSLCGVVLVARFAIGAALQQGWKQGSGAEVKEPECSGGFSFVRTTQAGRWRCASA